MIKPLGVFDLGSFEEFSAMEQDRLQKARIEQLEAALKKIAGEPPKDTWDEGLYWWAVEIAETALAGSKKDE